MVQEMSSWSQSAPCGESLSILIPPLNGWWQSWRELHTTSALCDPPTTAMLTPTGALLTALGLTRRGPSRSVRHYTPLLPALLPTATPGFLASGAEAA